MTFINKPAQLLTLLLAIRGTIGQKMQIDAEYINNFYPFFYHFYLLDIDQNYVKGRGVVRTPSGMNV